MNSTRGERLRRNWSWWWDGIRYSPSLDGSLRRGRFTRLLWRLRHRAPSSSEENRG